jgi:hypothetical protein
VTPTKAVTPQEALAAAKSTYTGKVVALLIGEPELTYAQVASRTGVARITVARIARRHGVKRRRGRKAGAR